VKRREFITLLGGAASLSFIGPRAACGQQPTKIPKIGVLYPGPQQAAVSRIEALLLGLRTAGYTAPSQVELLVRTAEGDPTRIGPLALEIVDRNVDVLFPIGQAAVQAVRTVTRTPIVAHDLDSDPVGSGLVATLSRPGGNITGVFFAFPDFAAKWLEMLREIIPRLSRVGVLWDPTTGGTQMAAIEQAAEVLAINLDLLQVRVVSEFEGAFASATRQGVGAILIPSSPLIQPNAQRLAELAVRHGLPAVTLFPDFARAGGLLAYGPTLLDTFRQAGLMVGKVLAGVKPAELPIELPTRFELVVNLRTAKALGISIPTSILLRADEVIE
jgi:putative tryptophan/tyrosine transport system substrate-binding protein